MSNLEIAVKELVNLEIDPKQAKMIAEIRKMNLPKPTYGVATPNEIFQLGLKQSQNCIYQSQMK